MSENEVLEELKKISRLLTFAHSEKIGSEIEKVATTTERKMIWALLDGKKTSKEIAQMIKQTPQAVNKFIREANQLGLAINPYNKPPYRLIDYVPPEWLDLIPAEETLTEEEQ